MNPEMQEVKAKMLAMLCGLNVPKLKELVQLAYKDEREGAGMVFVMALNVLEEKIPEAEYVKFLNAMH